MMVGSLLVTAALLTSPAPAEAAPPEETRISLDVKDADIVDVVRLLAEIGNFQVVFDPGVSCKLTLKLNQVPWPRVLDVGLKVCGLGQDSEGGIVRVAPLAKLAAEHAAQRRLEEEKALSGPLKATPQRPSDTGPR